jgi:hypothetical protein
VTKSVSRRPVRVYCLVHTVAVDVVVGPGGPVNGHPGGVGLGVEGAGGGVRLVRVDGDSGVALGLEVRAPGLVSLVPVAAHGGVVPEHKGNATSTIKHTR